MKKVFIAILVVLIIGVIAAVAIWNKPHAKVEDKKGIAISAAALATAFTNDEKNANAQYLNKAIEVTGVAAEVDKNQDGGTMVVLQTGDPMHAVQCTMRDKGATATKDKQVTIKGFCADNGIMGVSLTDCIIQ